MSSLTYSSSDLVEPPSYGGSTENTVLQDDYDELEAAMAALFAPILKDCTSASATKLTDAEVTEISQLLQRLGKREWSLRPRTYAVLRMINRVDTMRAFVLEGLYDISIPYSEKTLPSGLESVAARSKFLELQCLVMTTEGVDLESGKGTHANFYHDGAAQFESIKVLGSGGFGEVDHVRSRLSLDEFARKRIPRWKTFKRDKAALADFEREVTTLKRLSHRHLVKFVGSYTDPKNVGIIMSPVADSNLAEYLQPSPLPTERQQCLRSFFGCLSAALQYLHHNRIRHKDIKPGNILVHGSNVLLTDFGTALDSSDKEQSTTRYRPSAFSPAYCSPEVAEWAPRNSSSDIWSLGCVFFEMISVLKGQSLNQMREFFAKIAKGGTYIRTNPEATLQWSKVLYTLTDADNGPLEWSLNMLKENPRQRPTASQLYQKITSFKSVHTYCGPCCADDVEPSDSDDESVTADGAGSVNAQKPERGHKTPVDGALENSSYTHVKHDTLPERAATAPSEQQPVTLDKLEQLAIQDSSQTQELFWPQRSAEYDEAVELLLEQGVDVDEDDFDGTSTLPWAIFNGHESVVRLLVEKGADINSNVYQNGRTALHEVLRQHREDLVTLLLAVGASVTTRDFEGQSALHYARNAGKQVLVRLLVEHGADVNETFGGGLTTLHWAAACGYELLVDLLAEKGANLEAKAEPFGQTALMFAVENRHIATVRVLLERGANVNARTNDAVALINRRTPLYDAIEADSQELVQLLIEKGADVNATTDVGRSSLHKAAGSGYQAIAHLLIQKGARVNAKDRSGTSPLHEAAAGGHESVVRLLIENGANVAARGAGRVAVHKAAEFGHIPIVEILLEKGANTKARTYTIEEVLLLAASNGHATLVALLIQKGADPSVIIGGDLTLLQTAAKNGRDEVVRVLLENGADINAKPGDGGRTALHWAVEKNHQGSHEATVRALIEKGADLEATQNNGMTVLQWAINRYNEDLMEILVLNGANLNVLSLSEVEKNLRRAAQHGQEQLVQALLEKGPPIAEMTDSVMFRRGQLPLYDALREGHYGIAELLLRKGAVAENLSLFDFRRQDGLFDAARGGHEALLKEMIKRGVDLAATDEDGLTALDMATEAQHDGIIQLLEEGLSGRRHDEDEDDETSSSESSGS